MHGVDLLEWRELRSNTQNFTLESREHSKFMLGLRLTIKLFRMQCLTYAQQAVLPAESMLQ